MKLTVPITIPADIPVAYHKEFLRNYSTITQGSGRLLLFSCDHKIEHLNNDCYGNGIHLDALYPEHLFTIASKGRIGAMATHLGLIARYAPRYTGINYIVKLNGKTNLIPTATADPLSRQLWSVQDVVTFKKNTQLPICGVGYTIYLGSAYEQDMLAQAAQIVFQAHQNGLIAILWMYPRGKAIKDEESSELLAGATGVAVSLGADFVKIKATKDPQELRIATGAAGSTKIVCAGGPATDMETLLQQIHAQLHEGGTNGCALGRNIFQHTAPQAIALTHALAALIFDNLDVQNALQRHNTVLMQHKE